MPSGPVPANGCTANRKWLHASVFKTITLRADQWINETKRCRV